MAEGLTNSDWRRLLISHISALPKPRRPMFPHYARTRLPMQLDRQSVEGVGVRVEGV
jgi:hypothetical protein